MKNIKSLKFLIGLVVALTIFSGCKKSSNSDDGIVTLYTNTGGSVTGEGTYKIGSSVTVSASVDSEYQFNSWRDYLSGKIVSTDPDYAFNVSGNTTLVAYFDLLAKDIFVARNENVNALIVPNYAGDQYLDQLAVKTRYIGDLFINGDVSLEKSGAKNIQGNIQMVINTQDLNDRGLYEPIQGGGPHIWLSKQPSTARRPTPWANANELVLQMNAAIPHVTLKDKDGNTASFGFSAEQAPVTQLSFSVYLYDQTSNKTFAYIIPVYESRGTYDESANNSDTYTSFVSSPLEDKSKYITKSPTSEVLQSQPYSKKKFFQVSITKENLQRVIADSNINLSPDLSKYQLTIAGVLFELPNYVKDGSNTSMVEISDFSVFTR